MKQQILVVEDEPAIADTIVYALETEGFAALRAVTGGDALALLAETDIALAVVDVGLPDINGFDLVREIRRDSRLPVIFLTARASEIDRVVGLEIGGDDYVAKPFSPRELTARIRAVLRRVQDNPPAPSGVMKRGPFAVDDARRTIHYHGEALDLTRYEYDVLRLLVRHPGRVYTRDQLMERVWAAPEFSMDRTVDTHIKTLRAKLRAVRPDEDAIRTHRGVGYSLRDDL